MMSEGEKFCIGCFILVMIASGVFAFGCWYSETFCVCVGGPVFVAALCVIILGSVGRP